MAIIASYMVPHPPMIVPAVGRGSERQIEATRAAYMRVAEDIAALAPETIILSSPHATMYADYFHISPGRHAEGSFARFHAPQARFREEYDAELVRTIERIAMYAPPLLREAEAAAAPRESFGFQRGLVAARRRVFNTNSSVTRRRDATAIARGLPAGTRGQRDPELDHGTMVPLYFIRQVYSGFRLVRVGLSGLPLEEHYRLGQIIRSAVEETGRRAVFVASGDLSHKLQSYGPYGFAPEGPQYDARIMDVCERAAFGELFDFDEAFCERAAECGHRSFIIMAGTLDGTAVKAERLSHEDVTGVGYGICMFHPTGKDDSRRFLDIRKREQEKRLEESRAKCDPWVQLAWQSIERWVGEHRTPAVPDGLPYELTHRRAGAFVSIHKQGRLRGCIGTIAPTQNSLAEEIIHNAVSAATRDPRFAPVRADELKWLEINVDVLGEPEEIESESQLDVKRYGVIVTKGHRRGLLLPDLDGVDTVRQQVEIAKQKAGIGPKEEVDLQRFEVVRHT